MTRPYRRVHYCECTPHPKGEPGKLAPHLLEVSIGGYYPGSNDIRLRSALEEIWLCDECYAAEQQQAALMYGATGDELRCGVMTR